MKIHRMLAGVVLATSLLSSCGGGEATETGVETPREEPEEIAALAERLQERPFSETTGPADPTGIAATGEFVSPVRSRLVAKVKGRVRVVLVEEGQEVAKGQPMLELETDYLRPELDRAEAELTRARAALNEATSEYDRKQGLFQKESIPQAVFDRSKGSYEQAGATVGAAEASVEMARRRLADAVLYSPIDGVVAERMADVGERLGDATVAFVIVQLSPLRLRFDLPESQLPNVAEGQRVRAQVAPYPGEVFEGRVVMAGKVIDATSRTFSVEAEFSNQDRRLRPGLFARVELETPAEASSLVDTELPEPTDA